jgi:esterase/lipase
MVPKIETGIPTPNAPIKKRKQNKERGILRAVLFLVLWLLLISGGIYGTMLYLEQIKLDITRDIQQQTEQQLTLIHEDYTKQITALDTELKAEITQLQEQVQTFNELLTFANDSAKDETDNSNQLYTQLEEVKKQLKQLEKNLDVLK